VVCCDNSQPAQISRITGIIIGRRPVVFWISRLSSARTLFLDQAVVSLLLGAQAVEGLEDQFAGLVGSERIRHDAAQRPNGLCLKFG